MRPRRTAARDPFEALADPTRRAILELLRETGTRTAGEVARAFPAITRPAVSRHLSVLREGELVIAEQTGREWHYRLNVAALARLHRDWFARFIPLSDGALEQLKRATESPGRAATNTRRARRRAG